MTRLRDKWVHLYGSGWYTWCQKLWMVRRHHRRRQIRHKTYDVSEVDCPDCIAEYAANKLRTMDFVDRLRGRSD